MREPSVRTGAADIASIALGHDRGQHESRPCESRACVLVQQTPPALQHPRAQRGDVESE